MKVIYTMRISILYLRKATRWRKISSPCWLMRTFPCTSLLQLQSWMSQRKIWKIWRNAIAILFLFLPMDMVGYRNRAFTNTSKESSRVSSKKQNCEYSTSCKNMRTRLLILVWYQHWWNHWDRRKTLCLISVMRICSKFL